MNYCAPPEDKWLLVGIVKNTTQSYILVVLLLPELNYLREVFLTEKADFSNIASV